MPATTVWRDQRCNCALGASNRRSEPGRRASWPVGRVLCARLRGPATIHLGLPLPAASCGLPASIGRAALNRSRRNAPLPVPLPLDLAPGGVYQAAQVTLSAGGLLHRRFTLTSGTAGGGLFSVALSRGSPRVGVTDHPALRSPDLPRHARKPGATRPPGQLARRSCTGYAAQARLAAMPRQGAGGLAPLPVPPAPSQALPSSVDEAAQQAAVLAVAARLRRS
jgi:hypothetical protein